MRDSFIIYRSFYEAICDLDTDGQALIFKSICEYSLNFNTIELSGVNATIFKLIKPQLDANNKRFENGKKPKDKKNKSEEEPNDSQDESKNEAKDKQNGSRVEANVNDNVNNNVNDNLNNNDNENLVTPEGVEKFVFKNELLKYGFDKNLVAEWLSVRKLKKLTNSKTAFEEFIVQIEINPNIDKNEKLKMAVVKSWGGFKNNWYENELQKQKLENGKSNGTQRGGNPAHWQTSGKFAPTDRP